MTKVFGRELADLLLPLTVVDDALPVVDIPFASKEEEWVYTALLEEQRAGTILYFEYQVNIFGGRNVRGGIILDFVVYNPLATVLFVNGDYWHSGLLGADDLYQQILVRQRYPTVVTLWGRELVDKDVTRELIHEWIVERAGQSKD